MGGDMRFPMLVMALFVCGCDERQDLCDKAVEDAMKGKASYKLLEVIPDWEEREVEGKGISSYKYIYRYYKGGFGTDIRVGVLECDYVDTGRNTIHIHGKKEIEW